MKIDRSSAISFDSKLRSNQDQRNDGDGAAEDEPPPGARGAAGGGGGAVVG